MCTLIILRRPAHRWPLLLAGNRDEMHERPWLPPGRHWEDRPEVVAGLDRLAGGSWLGINDHGVVAVVTNREGSLGPAPGRRSRGELVLEALDHAEAAEAARALADLDPAAYRDFNLFIADPVSAWLLVGRASEPAVRASEVLAGLHMLTAGDLDDTASPRIRRYLPRFQAAPVPDPETGDWQAWRALLAARDYDDAAGPRGALNLDLPAGFGTVCSHLIALPRYPGRGERLVFQFAAGAPDRSEFHPLHL